MPRTKGIVSKKEQALRDQYQYYLSLLRKGGRSSLRRAKTQYDWRKATRRTKDIEMQRARS